MADGTITSLDAGQRDVDEAPLDMSRQDGSTDAVSSADIAVTQDEGPRPDQCAPTIEVCDQLDQDCDGNIDEDFDLTTDDTHCGECGLRCSDIIVNGTGRCEASACILVECDSGWTNTDGDDTNGCETAAPIFEISSPDADAVFNDDFDAVVTLVGIVDVGHVEMTANGDFLGRRAPPAELRFPVIAQQFNDGIITLRAEIVDLAGETVDTDTRIILLDRSAPIVRFVAPAEGLRDGIEPFDVRVEVDDLDPEVTVELLVDGDRVAFQNRAPFTFTLNPEDVGAGAHVIRAVARDRGGQEAFAERHLRLSFCSTNEMVAIPDMPVLIDAYENSRPDASRADPGTDDRTSCSQPNALPWSGVDYFDAEQACSAAGKRLCTPAEWIRACGNIAIDRFPYGNIFNMQTCNGVENPDSDALMAAGMHPDCATEAGAFDLSGNVAEWTDQDADRYGVRGGHYLSESPDMTCQSALYLPRVRRNPTQGFRCCRDVD
jgi:hypothetical protein